MRTPLVLLAGSLLIGCTVGDTGTGGGDDNGDAVCGDGVKEGSESCDDGNTANGDGCSSTCSTEATPRLEMVVDKTAIDTELATTHMLTATLVGSGGFGGAVSLTASVVDASNNPLPGWAVTLDSANVNVPVDGSIDAIATLTIPSENLGLQGTVKIEATSSLGTQAATSAVAALNQVTIPMTLNNGQCVYPAAGTLRLTTGSKIRFLNKAADNITIHMQGSGGTSTNLQHEPNPGSAPNTAYEQTLTGPVGGKTSWYCHAPGPNVGGLIIEAVAPVTP